jgi:hypothetical protein
MTTRVKYFQFPRYKIKVHRAQFTLGPDGNWWLDHPLPDLVYEGEIGDHVDLHYVVTKHVSFESVVQLNDYQLEMCTGYSLERMP